MNAARTPLNSLALRASAVRLAVALGVAVVAAIGLLLAGRRFAGALDADLPLAALAPTAALAGAIVFAGRLAWRSAVEPSPTGAGRFAEMAVGWGGSIALVLLAIGCSHFGQSRDWIIWLPLIVADQFHRQWFLHGAWRLGAAPHRRGPFPGLYQPDADASASALAPPPDGQVLQQLVRVRDAAGAESVRGTLRAEFATGQRTATLHVGFCPPLERLPQVDARPSDSPATQVKVAQAFAHGARLDVRLSEPASAACVVSIDFTAFSPRSAAHLAPGQ